jgi:hypothetical protein
MKFDRSNSVYWEFNSFETDELNAFSDTIPNTAANFIFVYYCHFPYSTRLKFFTFHNN